MSITCSFAGKRVLITGGASGIGRGLVQRFHDGGAVVFTLDKNAERIQKLKQELPGVTAVVVDLSNWEDTRKTVLAMGAIDHLVNNAGNAIPEPFLGVNEASLTNLFSVHVGAIYNISQIVAQGMIDRGFAGSIVNVSSVASRIHLPKCANYGPMKAAVENLTKTMAVELMSNNIRVNCIHPGVVETNLSDCAPQDLLDYLDAFVEKTLNKRRIKPNEIADLVIFLLSPLSSMITGQSVVIDGGYLAS